MPPPDRPKPKPPGEQNPHHSQSRNSSRFVQMSFVRCNFPLLPRRTKMTVGGGGGSDGSRVIASAQWSTDAGGGGGGGTASGSNDNGGNGHPGLYLKEFVHKFKMPRLVRIVKGHYLHLGGSSALPGGGGSGQVCHSAFQLRHKKYFPRLKHNAVSPCSSFFRLAAFIAQFPPLPKELTFPPPIRYCCS